MVTKRRWFTIVCVLYLIGWRFLFYSPSQIPIDIDYNHIFYGDINHNGKAVGFHYRRTGEDAGTARLIGERSPEDNHGVYSSRVEIWSGREHRWILKTTFSTFFPDRLSPSEVERDILQAYEHRKNEGKGSWRGTADDGLAIVGYTNPERTLITSAFPLKSSDD